MHWRIASNLSLNKLKGGTSLMWNNCIIECNKQNMWLSSCHKKSSTRNKAIIHVLNNVSGEIKCSSSIWWTKQKTY